MDCFDPTLIKNFFKWPELPGHITDEDLNYFRLKTTEIVLIQNILIAKIMKGELTDEQAVAFIEKYNDEKTDFSVLGSVISEMSKLETPLAKVTIVPATPYRPLS